MTTTREISRRSGPPSGEWVLAELIERTKVSETLAVFRFLTAAPPSFIAGQFATLILEADGVLYERPYSIASRPGEQIMEFFIELVPGGEFTPRLWSLKLGSHIFIRRRIVGHLTLHQAVTHHLMLATVTGIAPFVSIARNHRANRNQGNALPFQVLIIHGASRAGDFGPYRGEMEEMARDGWLTYVPTISRPWSESDWFGETGRVEEVLRKHADRLHFNHRNSIAYVCGHPQMVENVRGILARASFTEDQIEEEEYFPTTRSPGITILPSSDPRPGSAVQRQAG